MQGIINGFTFLAEVIKMIFSFISSAINTVVMVFTYLITIVMVAFDVVLTLPEWLQAFAIITISISVAYFLIGRNAGKSD